MMAMMATTAAVSSAQVSGEIMCLQAMYPNQQADYDDVDPLMAFKATSDPDTMYLHQAMAAPDRQQFLDAMKKEQSDQFENGNYSVVHKSEMPDDPILLPMVWSMTRKRDIMTNVIKKHKARMNVDGSRMIGNGVHYEHSHAPVASWSSIRMLLTMTAIQGWHTKTLDYTHAFPHAPIEREIYCKLPKGFKVEGMQGGDVGDYVRA